MDCVQLESSAAPNAEAKENPRAFAAGFLYLFVGCAYRVGTGWSPR
jgi:hypothetical protein